jgi:radical SAM superfamily enzyme YgiQ (UPF0313 family)
LTAAPPAPARPPRVFRPPGEAGSLVVRVTEGCSHNRCAFCGMYRGVRFRARPPAEVRAEIAEARRVVGPAVARAFLADGDALCLSTRRLVAVLDALARAFPRLGKVGAYANARDVLRKGPAELAELRRRKLAHLYLGLESGDDETLAALGKGATAGEAVEAVRRAREAGMATSVMVLAGVAGRARSLVHARRSAAALDRMEPTHTAVLTYLPTPGSPLFERFADGAFDLLGPLEALAEIRELVSRLRCRTHFACNHASNHLALEGRLPSARPALLAALDAALAGRLPLRPACVRGL